jgi:hypothetical protein
MRALAQELSNSPFASVDDFDEAYSAHMDLAFDIVGATHGQEALAL